jgi:hypothetical protein
VSSRANAHTYSNAAADPATSLRVREIAATLTLAHAILELADQLRQATDRAA